MNRDSGEYFVYVLDGSVVRIRYISVVYEGSDYYLCDEVSPEDSDVTYLGLNELIIIKGGNLFDGRILD